jgi:two-component SAPR family response regulator
VGYNTYLMNGRPADARSAIRDGLRVRPLDCRVWKVYLASYFRRSARPMNREAGHDG